MCCIAACYLERLTDDLIDAMTLANRDGFGMAWIDDGKVRWQKGLSAITAKLFARRLPLPYVAHARLATVGGAGFSLAHPFPIEAGSSTKLKGTANRVLFHNGHIGDWRAIALASEGRKGRRFFHAQDWSDSRAIAHVIATRGTAVLRELADSRFAVLSPKGITRYGRGWSKSDSCPTIQLSSHVEGFHSAMMVYASANTYTNRRGAVVELAETVTEVEDKPPQRSRGADWPGVYVEGHGWTGGYDY